MNQFVEAEVLINKALLVNPDFPYPIVELSRLKYRQQKYAEAKRYFDIYKFSVNDNLRPQDLELGYNIVGYLGQLQERNRYLNQLKTQYPYAEETLKLLH